MYIRTIDYLLYITVGITLVFLGAAAVIKIYRGSKIPFAYTMTASTCAYGVTFVGIGVMGLCFNERTKYVWVLFLNIYYLLSIQGLIFAIQYLESSVKLRETTCVTESQVNWIKWTVAASYSVIMIVLLVLTEYNWKIYFAGNCGD